MKRWVSTLLTLFLTMTTINFSFGNTNIVELRDIHDYWINDHKEILYLFQHLGIINGYPDNTFRPQNEISREEFIKILVEALGEEIKTSLLEGTFSDVKAEDWSYKYIETAVREEIIIPEDYGTTLQPKKPITRLEIAMMVIRALELDAVGKLEDAATVFADDESIPLWSKPYIQLASDEGIIQGYRVDNGFEFRPQNTATRAEAAIMIYRFLHNKTELKQSGYYAIDSFKQMQTLDMEELFHEVVFGWSSLEELDGGTIVFSMEDRNSDYRKPRGYEKALELIDQQNIDRKLMLTEHRRSLIYSLLENPADQEKVIEDIVVALMEYNFSGIVMDLETIRDTEKGYKSLYVEFLRSLKQQLDIHNYSLTVAVHPNNVIGYYDGYDYRAIGEIADEVNIMTHDYHDKNNQHILTDHAPIGKVQEALANLIEEGVPREKIILGLQVAAGTQWVKSEGEEGTEIAFYTPAMRTVYNTLEQREGHKAFDYKTMTPSFSFELIDNGVSQKRIIKYEDEKSLESKILLAKYYGIKGFSIWRIGEIQENILEILKQKTEM
ncbi:MAG: S-layer homology domain-containing protein [Clostridiaceae bacterium]|nr:S-layer homology domain-containing protein [Clostridiaceae bacterium]